MDNSIRTLTRQAYDIQKLRIATGLRVVAAFRSRFVADDDSLDVAQDEEAAEKLKDKLLKEIRKSYDRVTDGIAINARKRDYKFDKIIQSESEIWMIENYLSILSEEEEAFKRLAKALKQESFYNEWLSKVRGVGPAMAGVIMSELDPYKAKYPSSFWKYAGLDVVPVFDKDTHELIKTEGRGRRANHLVESTYVDRQGNEQVKKGLSHNPFLKSKLIAVLGTSFLRTNNEKYVGIYLTNKFRELNKLTLQQHPNVKSVAHRRALRYMIKQFLCDLHVAWRTHEGLEVSISYAEAKLGLTHGRDPSAEQRT